MALKNTADSYGWLAKLLHWTIAVLIVGLITAGLTFTSMERGDARTELAGLHKSVALLTLMLMAIRLIWRIANPRPADPPGTPRWQAAAALWVHWLLYAGVFSQLTIGLLVAGQREISFFGLFSFGPFLVENEEQHHFFEELHEIGWIVVAVLAVVHIIAALYHHFGLKDDVLRRMTTG